MQLHRGAREQYLATGGFPGSPPHHPAAQQQMDSFGRYQHRYHEQPQQQQQQQVHAHGHGMAAHARSPEGPSPGARAPALGPAARLRLQSPEGLLAHAHMVRAHVTMPRSRLLVQMHVNRRPSPRPEGHPDKCRKLGADLKY